MMKLLGSVSNSGLFGNGYLKPLPAVYNILRELNYKSIKLSLAMR